MRRRTDFGDRTGALSRVMAARPRRPDLARFCDQLRGPNRGTAVRAVADGAFVVLTLQLRGARPLFTSRGGGQVSSDPERSIRVAAAVDAGLGILPVAPSCLRRSVTLLRELHRLGLGATLHIGVRKVAEELEAHAWVQVGDVVVNDDRRTTDTYAEVARGDLERLFPLLH